MPRKHQRLISPVPSDHHLREVQLIEPKSSSEQSVDIPDFSIKHVAAYARVSSDQVEQEGSFSAQVNYYRDYIGNHLGWQLHKIYADKGISGTSYKHRPEFNQMLADAKSGKIDLILTKSISRFARNTVDSLSVTRMLKDLGVEVFFEKENISSFDRDAELVFTILSSLAQEESHAISDNVKWGKRRSMESGKVSIPYKNFLGYRKGKDGIPEIVESEARTVRKIYQLFLDGESYHAIATQLTKDGILTPTHRTTWNVETVRSILTNEKYKGDALLQKT